MKKIILFLVSTLSIVYAHDHKDQTAIENNIYRQEFKALKKEPFYKTIFDRRSNALMSTMLAQLESGQELSLIDKCLLGDLLITNPVAISSAAMPQLHKYIDAVCAEHNMRKPTILITKSKTNILGLSTAYSSSAKYLMFKGAILIGQDLLLETSQKALEAAIAYELAHIKYNHENKDWFVKWIAPGVVSWIIPTLNPGARAGQLLTWLLPRLLIAKRFEKQADMFVYKTMNNAEGLIELCRYFQHKEQRVEDEYAETKVLLNTAHVNFFTTYLPVWGSYQWSSLLHTCTNIKKWFIYNTFFFSSQSPQARIKAAQEYLDKQKQSLAV